MNAIKKWIENRSLEKKAKNLRVKQLLYVKKYIKQVYNPTLVVKPRKELVSYEQALHSVYNHAKRQQEAST